MTSSSSASPNLASASPSYVFRRPARQSLTRRLLRSKLRIGWRVFVARIYQTLSFFEAMPREGTSLTLTQPAGSISEEMLQVCQVLASDSEARLSKLESKATGLLSLIAVVIPLTASAAVFIRQNDMPGLAGAITLALNLIAMLAFLLALLAALRAVAVRGHSVLFLESVIDKSADRIRIYEANFFGRGLLHEAAVRHAICDHIADFVRAAQLFLVLGVLFAAAAAMPVLFYIREEPPATIRGAVSLDAASLREVQVAVSTAAMASDERLRQLESEIRALKDAQAQTQIRADIERLSRELAEMRQRLPKEVVRKRAAQ